MMSRGLLSPVACLILSGLAVAQEPAADVAPFEFSSGRSLAMFPAGDVYPVYVADRHATRTSVVAHFYTETDIEDSTHLRTDMKAGGRFGLIRLQPATPSGRSWQLSFDASLVAQFDSNRKLDAIGWDGLYGLTLTSASGSPLGIKLSALHRSAHVGDEYAERTGRRRIGYTREELSLGLSWRFSESVRFYVEGAYSYYNLYSEQEPGRLQTGLEYQSAQTLWGDRFAWFVAADASAMQERDWQLDAGAQAGFTTTSSGRRWRVGVQYYRGRPDLGEFYQHTEAYFGVGLWIDI